jgi:ribonucleotide reductase beta subunit family protein with ferritin-like domain
MTDNAAILFMVESFIRRISGGILFVISLRYNIPRKKISNNMIPMTATPEFIVHAKSSGCSFCDKAKALLDKHRRVYTIKTYDSIEDLRRAVAPYIPASRVQSFPLILDAESGEVIGGYNHILERLEEPILNDAAKRYSAFPLKELDIWALYKKAIASFWTSDEISLRDDVENFSSLSDDERHFITHILAFFASSDGIVNENLIKFFMQQCTLQESQLFWAYQAFNEAEHNITYSLLIDSLIPDPVEKATVFDAIHRMPVVAEKADWAKRWMDPATKTFAERLLAFCCVEGILFSGSFAAIFWLKQQYPAAMPGLSLSNQFISRDENLHCEHAKMLYSKLRHRLPQDTVHQIIREAVETEERFMTQALPCKLVGMQAATMIEYIHYVADRMAVDLGYAKLYHAENPFEWMAQLSMHGKTNFFESRVSEYQRASVVGGSTNIDMSKDDDDF